MPASRGRPPAEAKITASAVQAANPRAPDQTVHRPAETFWRCGVTVSRSYRPPHNLNIRKEERPDSSRTASKLSSRSNSRVAAQRDRVLPGAEAGKASSFSNFRITGSAPLVRSFGATTSIRAARRSISTAERSAASTPPTSPRRIAFDKPARPGGRVLCHRSPGRRSHNVRAAAAARVAAISACAPARRRPALTPAPRRRDERRKSLLSGPPRRKAPPARTESQNRPDLERRQCHRPSGPQQRREFPDEWCGDCLEPACQQSCGQKQLSRWPRIAAGGGEQNRVTQRAFFLVATAHLGSHGGRFECKAIAPAAEPGRVGEEKIIKRCQRDTGGERSDSSISRLRDVGQAGGRADHIEIGFVAGGSESMRASKNHVCCFCQYYRLQPHVLSPQ